MRTQIQQFDFTAGAVDEPLSSREDTQIYHSAALELLNVFITSTGSLRARGSMREIAEHPIVPVDVSYGFDGRFSRLVRVELTDGTNRLLWFHRTGAGSGGLAHKYAISAWDIQDGAPPGFVDADYSFNDGQIINFYQQGDALLISQIPGRGRSTSGVTGKGISSAIDIFLPLMLWNGSKWVYGEKKFQIGDWDDNERIRLFGGITRSIVKVLNEDMPALSYTDKTYTTTIPVKTNDLVYVDLYFPTGLYLKSGRGFERKRNWTTTLKVTNPRTKKSVTREFITLSRNKPFTDTISVPVDMFLGLGSSRASYKLEFSYNVGKRGDGYQSHDWTHHRKHTIKEVRVNTPDTQKTVNSIKTPTLFGFYAGRLYIAGFRDSPNTIIGSVAGEPFNFSKRYVYEYNSKSETYKKSADPNAGLYKDSAVSVTTDSDVIIKIKNIFTTTQDFFLFTSQGVFVRRQDEGVIIPEDFYFNKHSSIECSQVKPVQVDENIVFTDTKGGIHILYWDEENHGYLGESLSSLAQGIVGTPVRLESMQQGELPRLYVLNDEGEVSVLHLKRSQKIQGWTKLDLKIFRKGSKTPETNGYVLDICVTDNRFFVLLDKLETDGSVVKTGLYEMVENVGYDDDDDTDEMVTWRVKTLPPRPDFIKSGQRPTLIEGSKFRVVKASVAVEYANNIRVNGKDVSLQRFGETKFDEKTEYTGVAQVILQGYHKLGDPKSTIILEGSTYGANPIGITKLEAEIAV